MELIWIWLAITCLAAAIEFVTLRLIALWFAVGGLFAVITEAFYVPFWAPIIVFFAISIPLLLLLRKPTLNYVIARNNKFEFEKKERLKQLAEAMKKEERAAKEQKVDENK